MIPAPAAALDPRTAPGTHATDRARRVIVVGGGIAGIAAALTLAQRGVGVTILETRKKLGGRATSFTDVRTGLVIDNCQHVALGCCTNYLSFMRQLGVESKLRWLREIHWVEAGGRISTLAPGALPAPGHFAEGFLLARFLSLGEKLAIARAMHAILRTDRSRWGGATFGQWLEAHRQPPALIDTFWAPIVISACNLTPERVAASSALHVFQEGFLAHRDAAAVGVAAVPLVELYDPAEQAIARAGGSIRLGAGVEEIRPRSVRTSAGETLDADAVICAVPPERAVRLVAPDVAARDGRFAKMARITHSPILGVHLTFDRPVLPLHSAVLVRRPTQWVFRKDDAGAHVHAVISAADDWMALDEVQITVRVMEDITACFPQARGAAVLSSRAVKEKLATFAPTPEVEAARPATLSEDGLEGLVLAGDYVQTGWPATMEGAVRSGRLAAAAVLGLMPGDVLDPPLTPGLFARTIAPALRAAAPA